MGLKKYVQDFSGETERKELVSKFEHLSARFRTEVSNAVEALNAAISTLNDKIQQLNALRKSSIKNNITSLQGFLNKYGTCKPSGDYAPEANKIPASFPQQDKDAIDQYLEGIDLSSSQVFSNTFFQGIFVTRAKTQKMNLAAREKLGELQLKLDHTLQELQAKTANTDLEKNICQIYMDNVHFISTFIQNRILPELDLVDAFFETTYIMDKRLSGQDIQNPVFTYHICRLIGTPYERHYRFIRNTFLFYILACRIYDTAVLTNLFRHCSTMDDLTQVNAEKRMLGKGANLVAETCITNREGESAV